MCRCFVKFVLFFVNLIFLLHGGNYVQPGRAWIGSSPIGDRTYLGVGNPLDAYSAKPVAGAILRESESLCPAVFNYRENLTKFHVLECPNNFTFEDLTIATNEIKFVGLDAGGRYQIIGLLVIGAGVVLIFQLRSMTEITDQLPTEIVQEFKADLDFVPYVIIGLGSVIFLIAFSGCCGTITETKCLLVTYATFMALLAAAKIVITVLLFVKLTFLTETVENTLNNMFLSDDPYQNATFHVLEAKLRCCGTTGPESYVNDYNLTSPTCCEHAGNVTFPIDNLPIENLPQIDNLPVENLTAKNQQRENLPIDLSNLPAYLPPNIITGDIDLGELGNVTMCKKEDAYQTGCTTMIGDAVRAMGRFFGIGLIIVTVFELFAMFFTIYLIRTMKPRLPKRYIEQPRYYY